MVNYILGLSITSRVGATWQLAPQFGDLTNVEGGFVTTLGKFQASWALTANGYTLEYNVPVGTQGQLVLPCLTAGKWPSITLDGQGVNKNTGGELIGDSVILTAVGGSHAIVVD